MGHLVASNIAPMCGRFTYRLTWKQIVRFYRLTLDQPAQNTRARYNVCPKRGRDPYVCDIDHAIRTRGTKPIQAPSRAPVWPDTMSSPEPGAAGVVITWPRM